MARQLDPSIRAQLLSQSLDSCVRHGFRAMSLRALAQEIGTSHRMLIYHFGSAQQLFQAVLEEFRQAQVSSFQHEFSKVENLTDFKQATKKLWQQLAAEENRLVMLSSLEIQLDAIRQGDTRQTSTYLKATLEDWLEPIVDTLTRLGHSQAKSRLIARMITSAGRGLILDILAAEAQQDKAEVRAAFDLLIDSLQVLS